MAATFTWSVSDTDRNLTDGGITMVHWRCTGTETVGSGDDAVTYTASQYGTTSHTYDASDASFIAYNSVDEVDAIGWAKAELDVEGIESAIEADIAEQKAPTTGSGVPW